MARRLRRLDRLTVSEVAPLHVQRTKLCTPRQKSSSSSFEEGGNDIFNVSMSERFVLEVGVGGDVS